MQDSNDTIVIPRAKLQLLTPEGYFKAHAESLVVYQTQYLAWQALEQDLEDTFGIRRYSDFHSFLSCRSYYRSQRRRPTSHKR